MESASALELVDKDLKKDGVYNETKNDSSLTQSASHPFQPTADKDDPQAFLSANHVADDDEDEGHVSMLGPHGDTSPTSLLLHRHDDDEEYDDEYTTDSEGDEAYEDSHPVPGPLLRRQSNPDLPDTVTLLHTPDGGKVYVVGTAHFSQESQDDVTKTIGATQPDVVMVELCSSRVNILQLDEQTLLEEARNINYEKVMQAIKQGGVIQGILHILLLSMSAHLTKELGMAPGGEFRTAFREAQKIPGCKVHLGDRPIHITLKRALSALSWWQKLRLAWYMLTTKEPISKEEVEKCKQKDLLEEMLREMTGEFPALSQVFVSERDMYLAHALRVAGQPVHSHFAESGMMPAVAVGVVGIGHVPGIVQNWDTVRMTDVRRIMKLPDGSYSGRIFVWTFRAALVGLLSWGCYKLYHWTIPMITR